MSLPSSRFSNRGSSISCSSLSTACWCHTSFTTVKTQVFQTHGVKVSHSYDNHIIASHQTEVDLRSCERPRLIICGVMVEFRLRFLSTSSTDLSVFTGEWVE